MAARINEPGALSDVDLDEDARRAREQELIEKYHRLPVYRLEKENELREVNLPGTPSTPTGRRHVVNGSERRSTDREYAVDVGPTPTSGQPATVTVTEQTVVHQTRTQDPIASTKKPKRVGFGFPSFGRRGQGSEVAGEGRDGGEHHNGYDKNGATSRHTYGHGQGQDHDYDKPTALTVYPNYLRRPPGILRIVQLLIGIIVCASVNAERCLSNSVTSIVCASASSPLWYGVLGGQGYVLFVAIIFILGNFALIFYHICTRPRTSAPSSTTTSTRSPFNDKFLFAELAYNGIAVVMYIIAASVESWYASWYTLPVDWPTFTNISVQQVRNVYRPQWIAAAVFAWINVVLYLIDLIYSFVFRR